MILFTDTSFVFKMCTQVALQMHMLSGLTYEYRGLFFLWISKQLLERPVAVGLLGSTPRSEVGVLTLLLLVNAPLPSFYKSACRQGEQE